MKTVYTKTLVKDDKDILFVSIVEHENHYCGYIQVLNDKYYEATYEAFSELSHGGITYETSDTFGFDTGHYGNSKNTQNLNYVAGNLLEILQRIKVLMNQ